MKHKVIAFIDSLILYDYILFGVVALLFILFLILAIVLRNRVGISIFIILLAFATLLLGPTLGYKFMHDFLFKNSVKITTIKQLEFTNALLIKGTITNNSKMKFLTCKIKAGAYKVTGKKIPDMIYPYRPFKRGYLKLDTIIKPNETRAFKMFIEPFRYKKDYNVTIGANCR
jgi:hypothetical protein